MEFSVCIDVIGRDLPLEERLKLVSDCGFRAIEFWSWWDKDLETIRRVGAAYGLETAAFCTRMDANPGDPAQRGRWLEGLRESLEAARKLDCSLLIAQAGDALKEPEAPRQMDALRETLCQAAGILAGSGTVLALEPLNPQDHPGYSLVHAPAAFALLDQVNRPEIRLLFDIYHQQISEGNLAENLLPRLGQIAHFHLAGVPGRHEPSRSEINASWLLEQISRAGYQGFVGLEYLPLPDTAQSLREARTLLR